MNKIYKIVWNASLGAWVAVSEIAKGKTKTNSGTVGDVASNQKNEITLEKAFNYKVLFVAVFTVLVPAFSFAAVGNNSIDTRLCAATAGYSTGDIAVGCGSDSSGTNSIAIGGNATTKVATGSTQGGQSIAIGYDAQTKGDQSVGVGANVRASGNSSIAIGGDDLNKVAGTSNNTAAAQTYKSLTGDNLIRAYDGGTGESSQYFGTSSAGDGSVAIGVQASAKGSLATSFGTRTKADGVASTALGVGATSDKDGSVALGAGSKTDGSATKVQSATVNGLGFTGFVGTSGFAGTASDAGRQVSVGNIGNERQIKNLAPGAISAISTDAINGSQIYAVTNTLIGQIQTTKFASPVVYTDTTGNKLTKASDGKWYLSTAVDAGGNKIGSPTEVLVANVATRLQDANGSTTTPIKLTNVADGTVAANSKDAVNGGQLKSVSDAQTATDASAVKYDSAATKDKVTLGGATGTTISNVKAGAINAGSTDAVNGSQLYATNQNVAQNTANISTLNTTVSNQGTQITANTTDISTLKGGFTLQTNGTNAGAIKAGDTVDIGVADPVDTNLTATKIGKNIAFALNKDLNLNSITANQLAVGNITIDKATNTITGLSNHDLKAADFATKGRAATEEQLKQVISSNITEVVDASGNKVNIIDQVVNTKLDNTNQDSLFLTYNKQGQETTDRLTIGQTVQKMNTEGTKFFHTNADTSKGDLGTTNDSSASGLNSTAIGVNAIVAAGADSSVALGHNAKVQGAQSIAIGNGAEALGTQSISIGTGNKVKGNHSGAIGDPTIVNGNNSYSVGNNNQVLTDDTFVLGNNVTKTVAGSVVLGNGSAATTGAGVIGYALSTATNADKTAINKTTSTTGAVAVGDAASGIYRQITGVAAGIQDADAVNVVQLKAVGNQVVTTQNSLVNSLGGNAKVNANGTITGPTYNVAKSTQINVGDALDALDKAIESTAVTSKTTVTKGQNIVVNKSKNADGSDNYEIATVKDLTVDSVKAGNTVLNNAGITIGNNTVVLNNTGLIIAGGPSITTQGINAGNKQITNVAAGTSATDAVNKGQLDSAINNVASDVTQLSNNAVKYDTVSKDKITLGGTNGTTITNVKNGAVVKDSKDAVNGGQLWNVQQQVNQNTNDIQGIQTSITNINNGKSGLVQQQTPNGDITVGKDAGGTTLNVSGTQGDRVVTGVKDGAINATSKDAVNGSQLNVTNNKVAEFLGGGAGYNNITNSFTNPTYKVDGKDYNNVGGAVDALNKADQALGNRITNLGDRLEQAFTETNQRIDGIEQKANAGIAAAMSLEAAPFVAGKYTYAVGAAYHGGENAVGVTLRKTADNGRWSLTGGVAAASQGDPSVRIGISGVID